MTPTQWWPLIEFVQEQHSLEITRFSLSEDNQQFKFQASVTVTSTDDPGLSKNPLKQSTLHAQRYSTFKNSQSAQRLYFIRLL
jgi:hypothetical protein